MPRHDRPHDTERSTEDGNPLTAFIDVLRRQIGESSRLIRQDLSTAGRAVGTAGRTLGDALGGLSAVDMATEMGGSIDKVAKGLRGHADPTLGDVFNVAGALTGGGLATAPAKPRGSIGLGGGLKHSQNVVKSRHFMANRMERMGASPEAIYKATGFTRGPEGLWRFEIDDTMARVFKPVGKDRATLGEVLDHPELYKYYPQLKDLEVRFADIDYSGTYNIPLKAGKKDYITVSKWLDADELLTTVLHESQHAIQFREGFAKGAAPSISNLHIILRRLKARHPDKEKVQKHLERFEAMPSSKKEEFARRVYRRMAGEIEAKNIENRAYMDPYDLRFTTPEGTEPSRGPFRPSNPASKDIRKRQIVIPHWTEEEFGIQILRELGFGGKRKP